SAHRRREWRFKYCFPVTTENRQRSSSAAAVLNETHPPPEAAKVVLGKFECKTVARGRGMCPQEASLPNVGRQLQAVHGTWHINIGKDQPDFRVTLEHFQHLVGIARLAYQGILRQNAKLDWREGLAL